MKLTSDMLRQIIKEEIGRAEKAPISLTPNQLRKIIVAEAAKLTGTGLLSEQNADLDVLKTVIDTKAVIRRRGGGRSKKGGGRSKKTPVIKGVKGELDPRDVGRKDKNPDFIDYSKIPIPAELTKKAYDLSQNSFGTFLTMGRDITSKLDHFARGIKIIDDAGGNDQLRLLMKAYQVQEGQHLDKDLQEWLDSIHKKSKNKKVQKLMKDLEGLQRRINRQMKKEKIHLPTTGRDVRGYSGDKFGRYNYGLKESRILSEASRSDQVEEIQKALIELGYDVGSTGPDGDYGPATEKAMAKFQQKAGLRKSTKGAALTGPKTVTALIAAVEKNRSAQAAAKPAKKDEPAVGEPKKEKGAEVEADDSSKEFADAYMAARKAVEKAPEELPGAQTELLAIYRKMLASIEKAAEAGEMTRADYLDKNPDQAKDLKRLQAALNADIKKAAEKKKSKPRAKKQNPEA